jgi:hypothetical protein
MWSDETWQTCPLVSGVGIRDKHSVMPDPTKIGFRLGLTTAHCATANRPVEVRILLPQQIQISALAKGGGIFHSGSQASGACQSERDEKWEAR